MELVVGSHVTAEAVSECAHRRRRVVLPEAVLEHVGGVHAAARTIAERQPVYGRTTGVGANKDTAVADVGGHGARLLRSHAVAAGPPLPREHVRAMLVVRLQQLAQARSGIDPAVLVGLHSLLDGDCLPGVRTWGGVGTGDLPALAAVGLALTGERPTSPSWPGPPLAMSGESALPLISSSALTTGRAALGVVELERLARTSEVVFGLTAHAAGANPQHWSPTAARAAAHPRTVEVAARLSALLGQGEGGRRIQDRYGFRAFVHGQGVLVDRLSRLRGQVEALVNAGQENPLFDVDGMTATHHAGFYQSALAQDVDAANLALANTVPLLMGRLAQLNDPAVTGHRPFLSGGPAGSSGVMIVEYVAAAAAAELRVCAQPASLGGAVLSLAAEEDATFAPQAVDQLLRATTAWRTLLASELLVAARLIRLDASLADLPPGLRPAAGLMEALAVDDQDHDLEPHLDAAVRSLDSLAELTPR